MNEWSVFLYGSNIDTVFFLSSMEEAEVYNSLVYHDGYDSDIQLQVEGAVR